MKGFILLNAYSRFESQIYQANRLKDEFSKFNITVDIINNDGFYAQIDNGKISATFLGYEFCIYLDKDKYVSSALEKCGIRVFNSHYSISVCDDKMETFIALSNNGIRMPKTISGLLCFDKSKNISDEFIFKVEKEICYPIVVKECFGSMGKGVYLAKNRDELIALMNKLKCVPHLFQQAITESFGKDIRVIMIGNNIVASMFRQSKTDFRSNISLGGVGINIDLNDDIKNLCNKVSSILKMDYCGIDILLGKDNVPYVCEVNSNAFFSEIERITKVNVAKQYAQYIINKMGEND